MTNEPLLNKQFVSINDTSLHTDKRQGFTGYMFFFHLYLWIYSVFSDGER